MPSECRGEYLTLKGDQKLDQRPGGRGVVRKKSPSASVWPGYDEL